MKTGLTLLSYMNYKGGATKFLKGLTLFLLPILIASLTMYSCTDADLGNLDTKDVQLIVPSNEYEGKLKELSVFFGEVLKDKDALEELYSLASEGGQPDDIDYNLKNLFEEGINPSSRKASAIVSAFKNSAKNLRTTSENGINGEELIQFIIDNEISILAPYLVEDFKLDEVEEITVSWWTEEFEAQNIALDEDWKGATKAVKVSMGNSSNNNQTLEEVLAGEYFLADDEWAQNNPTIVFGAFQNDNEGNLLEIEKNGGDLDANARVTSSPVLLCNVDDKTIQNLTVRMPAFRLEENIAAWPKPNYIFLWVAHGNFTVGSNGFPALSPNVNAPFQAYKVSRKDARIERWQVTPASFIISSWQADSDNMQIVWGVTRASASINHTAGLKASIDDLEVTEKVQIALKNDVQLESAQGFDKCFTIKNNINSIDQGIGYYGNTNYPVYRFNRIRAYFTLEEN